MDMGPYYIIALVNMLGRVKSVCGMTNISYPERVCTCKEHFGEQITVETPTSISGVLQFESGAMGSIYTTFDVDHTNGVALEVYGSEGTLYCPDPNTFGGEVKLLRHGQREPKAVPLLYKYEGNNRALGLADMAKSIVTGRSTARRLPADPARARGADVDYQERRDSRIHQPHDRLQASRADGLVGARRDT